MKKFADAFNGLKISLAHKAVAIQFILAAMAIIGGLIIRLDYHEWLAFIICIASVISSEIFNTAIEKIGDYLNPEKDERIKIIKDLSSAGVLTASLGALAICIFTIIRRIIR
ncbi:MAG: diacylglycerol kinase [Erysipelotrichaceae bacterium]|nr:diacylglycerol kinase [Erysipelotrichaceae bacterium]